MIRFLLLFVLLSSCTPTLRVMTYNIHHGRGMDGKVDLERIAALIREADVDLVALNEVDKGTARTDGRDLARELAELCGMKHVFAKNIDFRGGEYGNAVLSRLPIHSHRNLHYRMLRPGEQRGLLQVTTTAHGRPLRFFVTHIDHREDDRERVSNVQEIEALLAAEPDPPVILVGDFNDTPGSRTHRGLVEHFVDSWAHFDAGDGFTYPSKTPRKRIDYVFLQKGKRLVPLSVTIPSSLASDHLPLVVEVRLR